MSTGPSTGPRPGSGTGPSTGLRTLTAEVSAETEEKKSRFLAFVVPHARFADRLAELRAEHPKANHHVTAFRAMRPDGRIEEGAKDDGEPSGTSGMPILRLLIGERLVDVGAIVVRYFGGTKLGTGGLARAYPGAVKAALVAALADESGAGSRLQEWSRASRAGLRAGFARASALEQAISLASEAALAEFGQSVQVLDRRFTENGAVVDVEGPEPVVEALRQDWS
ncbi:MAG: YigZ family protein [Pseudomonadota bacterium]|nr:YigZ family protein [Pseudomonadota bacterium]